MKSSMYRTQVVAIPLLKSACADGDTVTAMQVAKEHQLTGVEIGNIALHAACLGGHIETTQWVCNHFSITIDAPMVAEVYSFGTIEMLRWMVATGYSIDHIHTGGSTFIRCIHEGRLTDAKWLVDTFGLPDTDKDIYNVFQSVCYRGDVAMMTWMLATFPSITPDASDHTCALYLAFENSNFEMAKLLTGAFGVDGYVGNIGNAIQSACSSKNFVMARWVIYDFGDMYFDDVRRGCVRAMRFACMDGDIEVAEWVFIHRYNDVANEAAYLLYLACDDGQLDMAKWLTRTYNISRSTAISDDGRALTAADSTVEMKEWFLKEFK